MYLSNSIKVFLNYTYLMYLVSSNLTKNIFNSFF